MGAYVLFASVQGSQTRLGITGAPWIARAVFSSSSDDAPAFFLVSSPLPLGAAEKALREVEESGWWRRLPWSWAAEQGLRVVLRSVLARHGAAFRWTPLGPEEEDSRLPGTEELRQAQKLLAGRVLLETEAIQLLEQEGEGLLTAHPEDLIEVLALSGWLQRRSALQMDEAGRWRCLRCGSRHQVDVGPCSRCGRHACATCIECAQMGPARACSALVWAAGDSVPRERVGRENATAGPKLLELPFDLSPAQERVSQALLTADADRTLVWAACGAGKTEVVFPLIEQTLKHGYDVLFAVPRRDIAAELGDRLRKAFPKVKVASLYGGAVRRFSDAPLVVATTHQVLRLYRRFALVVLDEVDAFPYRGSGMLRRGVERAMLPQGKLVYMTATPTDGLLQRAESPGWRLLTIPARHHGYPLPVPQILTHQGLNKLRSELEEGSSRPQPPKEFAELVQRLLRRGEPLLVFVPTVGLTAPTAKLLDRVARSGGEPVADALPLAYGLHARDPRRDAVRDAFLRGEFPILVATTVLERGITIPRVNVMVLWADYDRVFDAPTLIQMAGRVGRTSEHPFGEVHYLAGRTSRAMLQAQRRIVQLNELAREQGYLIDAWGA